MAYFPASFLGVPWQQKVLSTFPQTPSDELKLEHLTLSFHKIAIEDLKIFIDSYHNAFLDETFFSQFLDEPTIKILDLPFKYIKFNPKTGEQVWVNEAAGKAQIVPYVNYKKGEESYFYQEISVRKV
jgi:hypothetical protein